MRKGQKIINWLSMNIELRSIIDQNGCIKIFWSCSKLFNMSNEEFEKTFEKGE
jgi:hypothetical protein